MCENLSKFASGQFPLRCRADARSAVNFAQSDAFMDAGGTLDCSKNLQFGGHPLHSNTQLPLEWRGGGGGSADFAAT